MKKILLILVICLFSSLCYADNNIRDIPQNSQQNSQQKRLILKQFIAKRTQSRRNRVIKRVEHRKERTEQLKAKHKK